MSEHRRPPFGGSIGKTVATSKPWWPDARQPPAGAPNILVVLFDDVGFSDFGCYGSPIRTPTIDRLAAEGLRYSGFHTTAMCSTTRAALLTGRNHHSVASAASPISIPAIRAIAARSRARRGRLPRCCGRTAIATTWSASGTSRR
ncbi:sulfatase-like hydrolase/transferase [Bradyrhizobium viridifuturi]|uniref:sulfatase-like hydrolase/transferase n=1 Tax=Bradyrhizobium viridifuturi TaxID=1654716 RepID=UPI000A8330CA|nr:sulfatase-like hydrolase/transferase [Bradyrhizobium viridifuturi]